MSDNNIVTLKNVSKSYVAGETKTIVLDHVDLLIKKNSFSLIFGPSGSGKTTLLNLIGALDIPDSGEIIVDRINISKMTSSELTDFRRKKIGFIFQFYNLLPSLTVIENVSAGLEFLGMSNEKKEKQAIKYLSAVGLGDKIHKFPHQLSGGEQQRVAIARALARETPLILADEPTGNLDAKTGDEIFKLMHEMKKALNTSLIVVSHNEKLKEYADRIIRIENGRVIDN
jgi:putative ABC transport system ATP-binding protein